MRGFRGRLVLVYPVVTWSHECRSGCWQTVCTNSATRLFDPFPSRECGTHYRGSLRADQNAKFWAPGLVLVGDSACFIDPVFSSGVHLATYAALLAARSINTCLDNSCPDRELREDACFGEFEARYRREYARFYEFLVAFYDTNNDLESYYWHAKRVTGSQEAPDRAFVEFLGGIGESKELVFDAALTGVIGTQGLSRALFPEMRGVPAANGGDRRRLFFTELLREGSQMQLQAQERFVQESQQPLFRGGLVPSADGLLWSMPLCG